MSDDRTEKLNENYKALISGIGASAMERWEDDQYEYLLVRYSDGKIIIYYRKKGSDDDWKELKPLSGNL